VTMIAARPAPTLLFRPCAAVCPSKRFAPRGFLKDIVGDFDLSPRPPCAAFKDGRLIALESSTTRPFTRLRRA
jgi:hypothetical protein